MTPRLRLLALTFVALLLAVPARAAKVNFAGDSPPTSTFAEKPACSSTSRPSRIITDANTNTPGATITAGGGANVVTADCDGSVWKVRGGGGGGTVDSVTGDSFVVVDDTDPANLLMSLDTSNVVLKGSSSVISSTVDIVGGLGIPNGTSCTSTTAGRVCLDTNGITEYTDPVLTLRTGGANKPIPIFTSLGTAGVAALFGKNASNAGTVYPIATTPTADAVPLANGSGKIDGGWLPGVSTGGTVAEKQASAIPVQVVPRSDGTKLVQSGVTIDDQDVLYANGLVIPAGGMMFRTWLATAYGFTASGVKQALECSTGVSGTTAAFNADSNSVTHVSKVCSVASVNPLTLGTLTVRLGTFATPANYVADELWTAKVYGCTPMTTGPDITNCTLLDRVVAENDATPETTYGTDRTAKPCVAQGCAVSIPLDGNGLSPPGDTSVAAGTYDHLLIVMEGDDDGGTDCNGGQCWTMDSDGDGGGGDTGDPGATQWQAMMTGIN